MDILKIFFEKTTNSIFTVITIVLLASVAYFGFSYLSTRDKIMENKIEADRQHQNVEAFKDSLEMKARELQDIKVFIYNLQDEKSKLKKENIYFKSKFVLLLDSV